MNHLSDHYVILDRSDPLGPKWILTQRLDGTRQRAANPEMPSWIPARLDQVGQPEPTEEGRVILWATVALMDHPIVLRPLPGARYVYRVDPIDSEETPVGDTAGAQA